MARLSGCSFELFGSLIKRLSQVPVMQPYNSSQARQERGNRAYLASQARPMQRSAHMLWLKGNMHTKRSKRGQPNTGLEEPVCADAYNQSNVCCMQLAWWGRAWFVDAGRLGTPAIQSRPLCLDIRRHVYSSLIQDLTAQIKTRDKSK